MSFSIVAYFENAQQAQTTCIEIRHLLANIRDARQAVHYRRYHDTTPTWAEGVTSAEYDIEWNESLDWIDNIDQQVSQFRNFVFVSNKLVKTSQTPDPVVALLEKFASQLYIQGRLRHQVEHIVLTDIVCLALDDNHANTIANELNRYLAAKETEYLLSPWESDCTDLELVDCDLRKPSEIIVDRGLIQKAVLALYQYQTAHQEQKSLFDVEGNVLRRLRSLQEVGYFLSPSLDILKLLRSLAGRSAGAALGQAAQVQACQITLPEIFFLSPEAGIPAVCHYLERNRCAEITLSLKSVPYASKPEYI